MQGELVFCEVFLHFVLDSLHIYEHIHVYSLLFWQDCLNCMALPIVVYVRHFDALVGSVIFIVRPMV